MREIILINVSGEGGSGQVATIMSLLAGYGVTILDICQSVIHNSLSLGIVIEVPPESESSPILKNLLFRVHQSGIRLTFSPISEAHYEQWVRAQGRQRHIVTLLGRQLSAGDIAALTKIIAANGLDIDSITRLSGRKSFASCEDMPRACVEFSVRGTPGDITGMRSRFLELARERGVDIGFQEDNAFRRNRRLVAFDMDSTLIQAEVIDELAKAAGAGEEVARITESAMRGEIDFKESLRQRVATLKGLDESVLEEIARTLPLTEGAERLISTLKRLGFKIAILSGGFSYFGRYLQQRLGVDYVHANELEIENGKMTGRVRGEIVDGARKAYLLRTIADREGIDLKQVIAVGDGANDLPMLDLAGLGIAFHAKPVVKKGAKQAISTLGLDSILYFIGLRDREV
jgi:phosphoserine phosphatase